LGQCFFGLDELEPGLSDVLPRCYQSRPQSPEVYTRFAHKALCLHNCQSGSSVII